MKCPLCSVEAKIASNKLVEKKDGTLAYRMDFECRSPQCPNFKKIIGSKYDPVTPAQDE